MKNQNDRLVKTDYSDKLCLKPSEYYQGKKDLYNANEKMINKFKYIVCVHHIAGVFENNLDKIFIFWEGIIYFAKMANNVSIEKQLCATISHEVLHNVLLDEQDINTCVCFDNIAESLQEYGVY
ncbi:MAG: hypothetical protein MUO82_10875 [Candidatus Thermoplasmatota archaeon]|nr:hypothetical protein [Candidatus Thermoplasmatota archaeon]